MYERFFGLQRNPFGAAVGSRQLFLTETHKEALSALIYGIVERKPLILMLGEVGVGKTTVLRSALAAVAEENLRILEIAQPSLTPDALARIVEDRLASPGAVSEGRAGFHPADLDRLNAVVEAAATQSGRVVIVIDEAQAVPPATLEFIRLLSDLNGLSSGTLQVVLVAQPELGELLERPDFRHLRQRIAVRSAIKPLTATEARRYLGHRIRLAGGALEEMFTEPALRAIIREAAGIPRRLNVLADNALLTGFGLDRRPVTSAVVREAIRGVNGAGRSPLDVLDALLAGQVLEGRTDQMQIALGRVGAILTLGTVMGLVVASIADQMASPRNLGPRNLAPRNLGEALPHGAEAMSDPDPGSVAQVAAPAPAPHAAASRVTKDFLGNEMVPVPGVAQIVHKVRDGETASDLLLLFYGRDDKSAVALFRRLNPSIDPAAPLPTDRYVHIPVAVEQAAAP